MATDPPIESRTSDEAQANRLAAERRWKSVHAVGWLAAALLALLALILFTQSKPPRDSTLTYPYLAAAGVYFLACCWVLAEGLASRHAQRDLECTHVGYALIAGVVATLIFLLLPSIGHASASAVATLNQRLFPGQAIDYEKLRWPCDWLMMRFNLAAALGNGAALASLTYIALRCRHVAIEAVASDALEPTGAGVRTLHRLLIKASVVLVTGTLTLFLLYAAAEQLRPAGGDVPASSAADAAQVKLDCQPSTNSTFQCSMASKTLDKPRSMAPPIALGVGLLFTGILFFLFMTASMAIDERVDELAAARADKNKSVKSWREDNGFPEASATEKVLQVLTLAAPAITGALTLAYGS